MKPNPLFILLSAVCISLETAKLEAHMMHQKSIQKEWVEENLPPFDEFMLSWNAERPLDGKYFFYASVKVEDRWTPWMLYSTWGSQDQASYHHSIPGVSAKVYQDALEVLENKKASGFRIKILSEGSGSLDQIHGLHVYTNSDKTAESKQAMDYPSSIFLPVAGISQMLLPHVRHKDLCSPTSTTIVTRYLSNNIQIDPVAFAQNAWDSGFDIFGNWVFNVAQASSMLGSEWNCWVERLSGFDDIYKRLQQGTPVIVSVRGPLPGGALPYAKGHLMTVIGYDTENQKVNCIDSAFPTDGETNVFYELSDFVQAWSRRGKVAYVFSKNQ